MYCSRIGLDKIIDKDKILEPSEKVIWKEVFNNLEAEQDLILNALEKKVSQELDRDASDDKQWDITTLLVKNEDLDKVKGYGFVEIIETKDSTENSKLKNIINLCNGMYSLGTAFLNCKYSEIVGICDKAYTGVLVNSNGESIEISYKFSMNNLYMEREKEVYQTALQYDIEVPIVLSPMARRAVFVRFNVSNSESLKNFENIKVDLQLEKNGLKEILLLDYSLMWNVKIVEKDEVPLKECTNKKIIPLFEKVYFVYEFNNLRKNEYILVTSNHKEIIRQESDIYINFEKDGKEVCFKKIILSELSDIAKKEISEYTRYIFSNTYIKKKKSKNRIRTKADIAYMLSLFSELKDVEFQDVVMKVTSEQAINVYAKDFKYFYPKDSYLKFNSASKCYLKFNRADTMFFEDYISYIISFMEYMYPEFTWVGVQ